MANIVKANENDIFIVSHHYHTNQQFKIENLGYETSLLLKLLEETKESHGPFELVPTRGFVNHKRAIEQISKKKYTNHVHTFAYRDFLSKEKQLAYVPFPVYLGILSYRTCFSSIETAKRVRKIHTLQKLKSLTIGQGIGWADGEILRHNGFRVVEVSNHNNLFAMAALNRIDLYCRGTHEVLFEKNHTNHIKNLHYDKSFALYYPMPLFFYTHKDNTALVERLSVGMLKMHNNGTLYTHWLSYHKDTIAFSNIKHRKIFKLDNPFVSNVNFDYEQYFYFNQNKQKKL